MSTLKSNYFDLALPPDATISSITDNRGKLAPFYPGFYYMVKLKDCLFAAFRPLNATREWPLNERNFLSGKWENGGS
jgi:hypothetical protein